MSQLKHGYNTFDNTGWPRPCLTVHSASGGHMLNPPGTGKSYIVLGMSSEGFAILREAINNQVSTGTIRATIPGSGDGLRFPGSVDMGDNMGIYVETGGSNDVTIWYYIKDEALSG